MALDFNIEPFFDDYSEDDKFYRILFRPGYAIQARELTQMQTILQQQIKRQGDHLFKNGSMVIPGQISYDNNTPYVKLKASISSSSTVSTFSILSSVIGKTYRGAVSGVEAIVLAATPLEVVSGITEADTLFVKYTRGAGKFSYGEIISPIDGSSGLDLIVQDFAIDALTLGVGTTASIERGIYYIKDNFVLVTAQTAVLSKYSSSPSIKAGLQVIEEIKYPEDDGYDVLLDNALGSPNYAAPGAARYYIDLVLKSVAYDLVVDPYEFIPLLTLLNGSVQFMVDKTEYAQIEKTLARRTYDESGDYTVRPFPIQVKEYRNNYRNWAVDTTFIVGDIVYQNLSAYKCILNHTSASTGSFAIGSNWIEDTTPRYNYGLYTGPTNSTSISTEITPLTTLMSLAVEPGKAYVKGYEVEKIATQYLTIDKARTTSDIESVTLKTSPGNYIIVNTVNYIPDIGTVITFYDRVGTAGVLPVGGVVVATARAKQIQLHATGKYKLFLFDIQVAAGKNFGRDAKFAYSVTGATAFLRFTAQIEATLVQVPGNLVTAVSSTTINAVNSTFINDFKVGDYINVSGTNRFVSAVVSNNQLTIDVATAVLATATNIYRVETTTYDPTGVLSVYPIPRYATNSTQNLKYTFYKKALSQSASVTITETGYVFGASTDSTNYIVVDRATGIHQTITAGTPTAGQFRVVVSGSSATFTMTAGPTYDIIYAIRKAINGSVAKKKVLTNITETGLTLTSGSVTLTKPDGFELIKVINSSNVNITSSFTFNGGQTESYCGLSSISTTETVTGAISVTYSYLNHLAGGDYIAVNSYTDSSSNVTYEELPSVFMNTIDFRPRKNNDGTWDGAVVPKYGEDTDVEYNYYYGRIDKLSIDTTGALIITKGIPGESPNEAKSPDNAMDLYLFYVEPYTFTAEYGIASQKVENKRYTMRDIGRLESRIKNLEYYTSLSMLEQNTINAKSYDKYGIERPQNGFLVDSFNGQGVGDVLSSDWKASIDSTLQELRPYYKMDQVSLFEDIGAALSRTGRNYEVNGDLVTLKIASTTPLVKQLRASHAESVNPFDVYSFAGTVTINPWSDTWFETKRRPDVIINDEGQYNAVVNKAIADGVLGTVWNAPQTLWFGETLISSTADKAIRQNGVGLDFDAKYGIATRRDTSASDFNFGVRIVTTNTIAVNSSGVRTGTTKFITEKTENTVISDKLVSTELIPYMRTRNILFRGEAFKPETRIYAFFDGINVDQYIKPTKRIEVVGYGATTTPPAFLLNTNVGSNVNSTARKVSGLVESSYTYGEVLSEYVSVSGGAGTLTGVTCVLLGQETKGATYLFYIDNILGGSLHSDSGSNVYYLKGEFTNATIKYIPSSSYNQLNPTTLSTTYSGQLYGTFSIPNDASMSFRTGVRQLRFTDSSSNNTKNELTYSEQSYESRGTIEWMEKTILSTRTAQVSSAQVSETWTLNTTRQAVGADTGWYDPLAQTFLVDVTGGAFMTDVDLFFASVDTTIPIKIEIRNVVNGYPGPVIVPFSTVIKYPSAIAVDALRGSVATNFKFPSPVYLQANTEYCLCMFADSAKYKLWVAQSGEIDVNGSGLISGQPYAGVLFKSQNASTWTADQSQDLKFQLNRAVFNTNTATLDLVNAHRTTDLYFDVLQANASNIILTNTNITSAYIDSNSVSTNINLGENSNFTSPKLVKSSTNEAGTPSMKLRLNLSTTQNNVSPVVDLSRCSATMISNVIDNLGVDNETLPDVGLATAKYVTKQINLNDAATTVRILFSACVPNLTNTDVEVYYKVGDSASTTFATASYTLLTPTTPYVKTQNSKSFTEAEYLVQDITPFTAIRVKLVFKSDNTSQVPRVKDLRVLAYA
jgi:hypothetical protein